MSVARLLIGMALRREKSLQTQLDMGLKPADFGEYEVFFRAMSEAFVKGKHHGLEYIGPMFPERLQELMSIIDDAPIAVQTEHYAEELLIERSILRVQTATSRLLKKLGGRLPFSDFEPLRNEIRAIPDTVKDLKLGKDNTAVDSKSIVNEVIEDMEKAETEKTIRAYGTGFKLFDTFTGGLRKGNYIVIAARSKVGKTSFWCSLLLNPILEGVHVSAFSIEMSGSELMNRLACNMSRVKPEHVRDDKMTEAEKDRYFDAMRKLYKTNLMVYGKSVRDFSKVEFSIRSAHRKGELDVVVIDYIQRYHLDLNRSRYVDLSEITNRIQALCKELNIPMVIIAQLNRSYVSDGKPEGEGMAYIKECGGIEQDADVVAILERDKTQNHTATLNIEGNRHGQEAEISLDSYVEYCRFEEHVNRGPGTFDTFKE